jgi:hypothetical protein
MIHYLTAAARFAPMRLFLKDWAPALRRRVRILAYEELPAPAALPDGVYVFADVDRIGPEATAAGAALWEALAARGPRVRLLNRPGVSLGRYELLQALHARGWNRFSARRLAEPRAGLRFPVFVRDEREHHGALTPLLPDAGALDAALAALRAAGRRDEELLLVEFLDTRGPDGLYRKYAATIAGERILAHHVMFGREWEVKAPSLAEPALLAENRAFQLESPHEAQLRELFALARIEWGRVDYAVLDGALQVWEINTNPTLLSAPRRYGEAQLPAKRWFARELTAALVALDESVAPRRGRLRRWLLRA